MTTTELSEEEREALHEAVYARVKEDLDVIADTLGNIDETLYEGLPGGPEEQRDGYDEQLVRDIAQACRAWMERHPELSEEVPE